MELKSKHVVTRRLNMLRRAQRVQEVYQKYYVEGMPDTVMHKHYIEPGFCISLPTMRLYLGLNLQKELKDLGADTQIKKGNSNQLELFEQ
jgi:hypothetical protein